MKKVSPKLAELIYALRSQKSVPLEEGGVARKEHERGFWGSGHVLFLNLGAGDERGCLVCEQVLNWVLMISVLYEYYTSP